jgi:hypothetical protein
LKLLIVVGDSEAGRGWRLNTDTPVCHAIAVPLTLPADFDGITDIDVILAVAFVDHFEAFCHALILRFFIRSFACIDRIGVGVVEDGRTARPPERGQTA